MSAFEVLFSFYGLLLGLAVASVAGGMGDLWRRRRKRRVGTLTPLLGLYILLAATHQWLSFWGAREGLDMTPLNLLVSLTMALPYVFTAHIMFPEPDDPAGDGDSHFCDQRRVFLGVLMIPLMVSLTYNVVSNAGEWAAATPVALSILHLLLAWGGPLLVLGAMIPARQRAWQVAGLMALIADRLILILT